MPPYGGKSRRGYGGYKSRGFKKRKKMSLDKRIEKVLEKQSEMKFKDFSAVAAALSISTTGTVLQNLCVTAIGDDSFERTGRRIQVKKLQWRFTISLPTSTLAVDWSDVIRIILVQVKNTKRTAMVPGDILHTTNWLAFNKLGNKGNFRTLFDRIYEVNANTGDGTTGNENHFINDEVYLNVDFPIDYNGTSGAIAQQLGNSVQALLITQGGNAKFNYYFRIRFTDL